MTVDELGPAADDYVDRRRPGAPGGASFESRALMAFEAARARQWLDDGTPLVASLSGRLRVAIAGFIAGGHAALDALAALDFDIYADPSRPPRTARADLARYFRRRVPWQPRGREQAGMKDAAVALAYKHCERDHALAPR